MTKPKRVEIPAPKFDQYEDIWLLFQGQTHPSRVVKRMYDIDAGCWYYQVPNSKLWFIEDDLSHRLDESTIGKDK